MNDELWDKYQMMIDAGLIEMVAHVLEEEVQKSLTKEQLNPLGDLRKLFIKVYSTKQELPARKFIAGLIDMAKQGAFKAPRTDYGEL